jgi:hypothetical protein
MIIKYDGLPEAEPEALLTTEAASAYLKALGIPRSPATLTRQRSVGGETPPHRRVGRAVRYHPADLKRWVEGVVTGPMRNTSDVSGQPLKTRGVLVPSANLSNDDGSAKSEAAVSEVKPDGGKSEIPASQRDEESDELRQ